MRLLQEIAQKLNEREKEIERLRKENEEKHRVIDKIKVDLIEEKQDEPILKKAKKEKKAKKVQKAKKKEPKQANGCGCVVL